MHVSCTKYTITGVPSLVKIDVSPTEENEDGVRITLDDGTAVPRFFGLREFGDYERAMREALICARKMASDREAEQA